MRNKKGISLITLIITIVVMLIIAGAVIINVVDTNIVEESDRAANESNKTIATDEVKLVVYNLYLKESQIQMTDEEIKIELENKLKKHDSSSTVERINGGFIANHRGYVFEINDGYEIVIDETNDNQDEGIFNAKVWDRTATNENLFEWDETGTIIVGYKEGLTNATKIRIPSKCVAIIPKTLWQNNSGSRDTIVGGIKKVELPETITTIGNCAFADFRSLEDINIPNSVTVMDKYVFSRCSALTTITIPDNVINIGYCAFAGCTSLGSITIPNSVTSIGDGVFSSCTSLTSITLSNSITSIGDYTFSDCPSLGSITIPNSVTSIGDGVFSSCTSLTSIIVSDNVINMGDYVFAGWTSNQTIYCEATVKPDGWNDKWNCNIFGDELDSLCGANIVWGHTGE